jgi:hypothetical protein
LHDDSKTLEETETNIREAIEGHLRTLRDFGDPVPQPTSVAKTGRGFSGGVGNALLPLHRTIQSVAKSVMMLLN